MKIDANCEYLFSTTGAKRWLNRNRLPRANALVPLSLADKPERSREAYLYADDPRCLALTESLAERLTDTFPTDVLPTGFAGPTSVPGDFYSVLNVSGYGMDPLPIPVSDNAQLIASNDLASRIRAEDAPFLEKLVGLFFGHAVPANLHIRKQASSGLPFFTTDNQYKKLATLKILTNVDDWLDAMVGDRSALKYGLNEYHSLYCFSIQERQQPNSISKGKDGYTSKPRTAPTEREAREGSYLGKTVADMCFFDANGNVVPNHFAMRRRDVFGGNGPINYALTAIVGCFREVYLNRFAFTYKTRDRHDKQRKSSAYKYIVGSDVKTMDKMVPRWFTEFVFSELTKYLDERVVEVMRRKFQAPYVVPPPWRSTPESYNPVFGGDPLDPKNLDQHVGLPSGIAFNPDWGKLWMTFVYVVLYKDIGAIRSPSDIEPLLSGKNPDHALLDMSDDAAFLTNSAVIAERLKKPASPYAVLEVETPVIFLGDVFCDVGGRREVYPNPLTYVINALCREDSIDRDGPVAWAEGFMARFQVYSSSPIFRDVNAIYEEEFRKHVGINPYLIARTLAKRQRFNDVDAMVRMSPAVLHYKVDPKDVSPAVLDELVATIPASDFFDHIKHLFKVPTVSYEEIK